MSRYWSRPQKPILPPILVDGPLTPMSTSTSRSLFGLSQARAYRAIRRERELGAFCLFPLLPAEIQVRIINFAGETPRISHMKFKTDYAAMEDGEMALTLFPRINPDPIITPILQTNWLFRTELLRNLAKIELLPFGTNNDTQLAALQGSNHHDVEFNPRALPNLQSPKRISQSHVYMIPQHDILYINYNELLVSFLGGGGVDLSSVEHLALYDGNLKYDYRGFESSTDVENLMYNALSRNCPCLKKISIILRYEDSSLKDAPERRIMDDDVIFDIEDDFKHLDFQHPRGRPDPGHLKRVTQIVGLRKRLNKWYQNYIERDDDTNYQADAVALRYWKSRTPTVGIVGKLDMNDGWLEKGKLCPEPRLWLKDVKAYVPVCLDGTLFHEYSGMAQLFGEATW